MARWMTVGRGLAAGVLAVAVSGLSAPGTASAAQAPAEVTAPCPDGGQPQQAAAAMGAGPVRSQAVLASQPPRSGSGQLGVEPFYAYRTIPTGGGTAALVNQANGNLVLTDNLLSLPGRGLAGFLRLTYNSLDGSDSGAGIGWSVAATTLPRLGSPLDIAPNAEANPASVTLDDGDGNTHTFTANRHGSTDPTQWTYDEPAGVHLYVRRLATSDPTHVWRMTRPDGVSAYFGADGYETAETDRNGNTVTFTYDTHAGPFPDPAAPRLLTGVTDAAGRRLLSLAYYAAPSPLRGHLASITDLTGRRIEFEYGTRFQLTRLTDGAGTPAAKDYTFSYAPAFGTLRLATVNDPDGGTTRIGYTANRLDPASSTRVSAVTDRTGAVTRFDYVPAPSSASTPAPAPADPSGSAAVITTVTDADGAATTYAIDPWDRPVAETDPLGHTTRLSWDADNNVQRSTAADGTVTSWRYDPLTGDPLTVTDPLGGITRLSYRTSADGHTADLTGKLTPAGRRWVFGVDDNGNLLSVTDPRGTAPGVDPARYTTHNVYDAAGQLLTATDADGDTTTYADYTDAGLPARVTDAMGATTRYRYDGKGDVTAVTDPYQHTSTYDYDVFGRPLGSVVPMSASHDIVTPAPRYDGDDDVLRTADPTGPTATTYATYDADNRVLSVATPPADTAPGALGDTTVYAYDHDGRLMRSTTPQNAATGSSTTYAYDAAGRQIGMTDPLGNHTTYGYDVVGNVISVLSPRGYAASFGYDADRRRIAATDAEGYVTHTGYDADGNVTSTTDQCGAETLLTLDGLGKPVKQQVPMREAQRAVVYSTTEYAYDGGGDVLKVTSPRGADQADPNAFAQVMHYDKDHRRTALVLPYDPADPRYHAADEVDYKYDLNGDMTQVSAPPSAGQPAVRNVTTNTYYDNHLLQQSTDPWGLVTGYGYDDMGRQTSRTLTGTDGSLRRTMTWAYFPGGQLRDRTDDGVPAAEDVLLVGDSDPVNAVPVGDWPATTTGGGFVGFDYRTHVGTASGPDAFTWKTVIPTDGTYRVFAHYPQVAGAARDAVYTITRKSGKDTRTVDQTRNAGDDTWTDLGDYAFTAGETAQVSLSGNAHGTVVANAVKLVRDVDPASAKPDHKEFAYSYDADGNVTGMRDLSPGASTDQYAIDYDPVDRPRQIRELYLGAVQHTTGFSYDADGDLGGMTHDRQQTAYGYDDRDLLNSQQLTDPDAGGAGPKTTTYAYDPAGRLQHEVEGNHNAVDLTYFLDGLQRHRTERKADQTLVSDEELQYDADGNRTIDASTTMNADNHAARQSVTTTYGYDPRDRVDQLTKSGDDHDSETYVHDPQDNIIQQTVNGTPTTFDYDRNRLVRATVAGQSATYAYDTFGRLSTVDGGGRMLERYRYDGFDRVVEHAGLQPSGGMQTTDYTYDPLDRVVTQTTGADTTKHTYLGLTGQTLDDSVNGRLQTSYQYDPTGRLLEQTTHEQDGTTQDSYFGFDPHDNTVTLTDEKGDTRATYGYTAYGQPDPQQFTGIDKPGASDPTKAAYNVYRYNAMRFDPASGTYNMGFRDYAPKLNQFLTRDSYEGALADLNLAADPFTGNRYAFAAGNPVGNIEIDGHDSASDTVGAVVGTVLGWFLGASAGAALGAVAGVGACMADGACGTRSPGGGNRRGSASGGAPGDALAALEAAAGAYDAVVAGDQGRRGGSGIELAEDEGGSGDFGTPEGCKQMTDNAPGCDSWPVAQPDLSWLVDRTGISGSGCILLFCLSLTLQSGHANISGGFANIDKESIENGEVFKDFLGFGISTIFTSVPESQQEGSTTQICGAVGIGACILGGRKSGGGMWGGFGLMVGEGIFAGGGWPLLDLSRQGYSFFGHPATPWGH